MLALIDSKLSCLIILIIGIYLVLFEDDELVATCTLKQMNYVGKCHKAILENNFVKIMMKLLTEIN